MALYRESTDREPKNTPPHGRAAVSPVTETRKGAIAVAAAVG